MKNYNAILVGNGTMGKRHRARFEKCGVKFLRVLDVEAEQWLESEVAKCEVRDVDFAVVASPASTHFKYAKFFLENKIPVLVEKPLAENAEKVKELSELSKKNKTLLFVAQSECYNPIFLNFRKHLLLDLKQAVAANAAVDKAPLKVKLEFRREHGYCERCRDVDVALDLLIHDVSLFLNLFDAKDVMVVGESHESCGCSLDADRETLGGCGCSNGGGTCGCNLSDGSNNCSSGEVRGISSGSCNCGHRAAGDVSPDCVSMTLKVVSGEFAGVEANFYADRNSPRDQRTISVEFGRNGNMPGFEYSVSLVRYTESGEVAHIPDALDNEHRFFLKLLAGACGDWAERALTNAADTVVLALRAKSS